MRNLSKFHAKFIKILSTNYKIYPYFKQNLLKFYSKLKEILCEIFQNFM